MAARVVLVLVLLVGVIAWLLTPEAHDRSAPAVRASPAAEPARKRPQLPPPPQAVPQVETLVPQPVADAAPRTGLLVHVTDTQGAPLEGMSATASVLDAQEADFEATSGADGSAWMDCAAGTYVVCATDERPEANHAPTCLEAVDVGAQGPTEITLALALADCRVEAFVRDDTGQPLAGVEIDGSGLAPDRGRGRRSTDEKGSAVWEPVVAGSWSLRVESVSPGSGIVHPDNLQAQVLVDPGGSAWHEFVLARQGTVVVRLADVPHVDQLKSLTLHSENQANSQSLVTSNESEIRAFVFTWRVEPGEHVLAAEWRPEGPWWSRPQTVRVEAGQTTYPVIEPLEAQLRVSGHVRDRLGVPVAGVGVTLRVRTDQPDGDWKQRQLDAVAEKTAVSADDGQWSLDLPQGTSVFFVNTATAPDRYLARFEREMELTDLSRPVEITVSPGCLVSGRVEGAWAKSAAEGDLRIDVVHEQAPDPWAGQRSANLGADATFEFRYVGAGTYTAVLKRSGQVVTDTLRFEVPASFEEGEAIPVTLDFPEAKS